ncbi:N-terminal double-transmembrane domain-containing protein [Colwellia chukchiensis]|uniref:N-terminal double-transmembrane domain-containing protein n=1 Tax=Colwellia chukchiensis TaxID=641665 RepID=A0A1H7NS61_9GAMM|nr:BatA domain-containing protein [Colwellia chukchiensis]SEL26352.1 N-terminal double-transmembrane domain-containing protein [Colwellia chukchiensis]
MLTSLPTLVLQNPWAIYALLALMLPVIVHLLSRNKARLVAFANIALIKVKEPKNLRHMRLTQIWLLLLRLLLLVVSILLLANISVIKPPRQPAEVYLFTKDWLKHSDVAERQQLLTESGGVEMYLLAPKTRLITAEQLLHWPTASASASTSQQSDTTQGNTLRYLEEFSQGLAATNQITLWVTDSANQYTVADENTPLFLPNEINWQIKPLTESVTKQYPDALQVLIIYQQARQHELKYFQQAFRLIKQYVAPKLELVSLLDQSLKNPEKIRQVLATPPDWLFYLSTQAPSQTLQQLVSRTSHIVVDASTASAEALPAVGLDITPGSADSPSAYGLIYRRSLATDIAQQLTDFGFHDQNGQSDILWQIHDNKGVALPMLTSLTVLPALQVQLGEGINSTAALHVKQNNQHRSQSRTLYQLHSRFSPSWSNLILTEQWPNFLKHLLFSAWQQQQVSQQYRLTARQIKQLISNHDLAENTETWASRQRITQAQHLIAAQQKESDSYNTWLVILLLVLSVIERGLSELTRPKPPREQDKRAAGATSAKVGA